MNLATIQIIHSITPHPNPEVERFECAKVLEWPVVIPKGQFKNGEKVVFITIDSIVPDKPIFEFMRRQKFRVWNARFKGAPSSGLVQPLSILKSYGELVEENGKMYLKLSEEIIEKFGVKDIETYI